MHKESPKGKNGVRKKRGQTHKKAPISDSGDDRVLNLKIPENCGTGGQKNKTHGGRGPYTKKEAHRLILNIQIECL